MRGKRGAVFEKSRGRALPWGKIVSILGQSRPAYAQRLILWKYTTCNPLWSTECGLYYETGKQELQVWDKFLGIWRNQARIYSRRIDILILNEIVRNI